MKKLLHIMALLMILLFSCSSAPKDTGDIYDIRKRAESVLDLGNREAGRGNFETALVLLDDCVKKAILVDDTGLIIRSRLSRGNILISLNKTEEALSQFEISLALAKDFGNAELLSLGRIYMNRGQLAAGSSNPQAVLESVNRELPNIKNNLYIAFGWYVKGLALRQLGSYKDAEDAVKKSLDIHEKEKYLEDVSYDWYLIASIRSLAGNYKGALEALDNAITLDRRIENSWGLASDWRAVGDVQRKSGNIKEASEAYEKAAAIFRAMGKENEAKETENRAGR
jgi:tetratricopeptide (TPR) repeat protein